MSTYTNTTAAQQRDTWWNPHKVSPEEAKQIPDHENQELVMQSIERGSIWMDTTTKAGKTISITHPDKLTSVAPKFAAMLQEMAKGNTTHLIHNGFTFSLQKDRVSRAKYEEMSNKPGGGKYQGKPYTPSNVDKILVGPFEEINDFLAEENKAGRKWYMSGDWKFDPASNKATVAIWKAVTPAQ